MHVQYIGAVDLAALEPTQRAFVLSHRADLPLAENVDVIAGGPPCQGVSGFNLFRHSDDPLNDTKNQQTIVFCDMCLLQKPSYVIMENVVGILMFADSLVLKQCMQRFLSGGYQVRVGVCVSGTFGLPQNRARTILFGARQDEELPAYPKPTHKLPPVPISMMTNWMKEHLLNVPTAKESLDLEAPLTLRDAFSDLPSIKAKKRGFGENAHNRAPKERSAQPYRAVKYKGKTSAGLPVEPQTDFQRDARQGCGEVLHDHESFVLNTDDQERVKRLRTWINVVTENYNVSAEEKLAIECLYQDKMDELDREVAEQRDKTDTESINLACSESLSRSTSGASTGSVKSDDSAAGPMIAIIKARPAVKSVQFKEEQLGNIKIEPVTPQAPEASKGVQPVYCPSESLPKDIEDLAVTDPQLCPWCSQPCRDSVQVGKCDGPPVEYCE